MLNKLVFAIFQFRTDTTKSGSEILAPLEYDEYGQILSYEPLFENKEDAQHRANLLNSNDTVPPTSNVRFRVQELKVVGKGSRNT